MTDLDARGLYTRLRDAVAPWTKGGAQLVGIVSGGAWLAERLQADLRLAGPCGVLSSTLHRDDFAARGLVPSTTTTRLPFAIEGAHIVLVDDVLHTGRTVRAAINELYDFGRPASVRLAVLADRGRRELPYAATFAATTLEVPAGERLVLAREAGGHLVFTQRATD